MSITFRFTRDASITHQPGSITIEVRQVNWRCDCSLPAATYRQCRKHPARDSRVRHPRHEKPFTASLHTAPTARPSHNCLPSLRLPVHRHHVRPPRFARPTAALPSSPAPRAQNPLKGASTRGGGPAPLTAGQGTTPMTLRQEDGFFAVPADLWYTDTTGMQRSTAEQGLPT